MIFSDKKEESILWSEKHLLVILKVENMPARLSNLR